MSNKSKHAEDLGVQIRKPHMYAVTIYNDDVTTMDFVTMALIKVFHKTPQEASMLMMQVHDDGKGIAGVYTFDIAVTKKMQTLQLAGEKGFPLKLSVDEVE